jgi:hypothetical protein
MQWHWFETIFCITAATDTQTFTALAAIKTGEFQSRKIAQGPLAREMSSVKLKRPS